MRVPFGWLQELVPVPAPSEEVQERLTMAGFEVEEVLQVDGETVFDIKVTSNRGDALSMVGMARETAALFSSHVVHPPACVEQTGPDVHTLAKVVVEAPDLCPRYAARVIQGVKIGPSPAWVQQRLTQAGIRPINNVVDATNFVMVELGQPLHAFDLDTLAAKTIVVRRAHPGEKMATLDGVERTLTPDMLLIADAERGIALAGIMGGENTEVTAQTTNILLESAHFDRTSVRRTARANTLSTESSYRFERIVDPQGVIRAADRAAQLIKEWSGGEIATGVIDVGQPLLTTSVIVADPARINAVLGTDIPREEMVSILHALELGVREEGDLLSITTPSFRPDLHEEMDIVEEVARIYGYQHVPATVPGNITGPGTVSPEMAFESMARELLVSAGLFEGISYSLIDLRLLDLLNLPADAPERTKIVPIRNPKSEEYTHLRPSMLLSMMESLQNNARRNIEDVQLFEMGRIFRSTGGGLRFNYAPGYHNIHEDVRIQDADKLPLEQRTIGIALMGRPWTARWGGGEGEVDFFWLKGVLEQFFADMEIVDVRHRPAMHPSLHPGRTAQAVVGDTVIALFGEVHPRVAANFDLPRRAYFAEINLDALMELFSATGRPAPQLSRFPAVWRDIAFLVRDEQPADTLERTITAAAGPFITSVELFDLYKGPNIPSGMKSLAYRLTFRAPERTLDDAEVDGYMEQVRRALVDEAGATLR